MPTRTTHCFALITARGGSKGLPGKNVRPFLGKPLIAWTIEAALASKVVDRVIVSTDDDLIAEIAAASGAEVPFRRPAELSQDDSPHILTSLHALDWVSRNEGQVPEFVVLLQPTSPLRTGADIDGAMEIAVTSGASSVVSVCAPRVHPGKCFFINAKEGLEPVLPSGLAYKRRQDLPRVVCENGAIYLNRCAQLLRDQVYINEHTRPYVMPYERSVDIDDLTDFRLAETLATLSRHP